MAKAKTPPPETPAAQDDGPLVRVELTTGMAGDRFSYAPGQLLDVDQETADRWIERGIARDPQERLRSVHTYREQRADVVPAETTAPAAPEVDADNPDDDAGELDD